MGNMCTFGRVRKPHGHVQADARSTRMGANWAGASAGRGGQAAAVERAGSVSAGASAGRGERTEVGGGGGARSGRRRRRRFSAPARSQLAPQQAAVNAPRRPAAVERAGGGPVRSSGLARGVFRQAAAVEGADGRPVRSSAVAARSGRRRRWSAPARSRQAPRQAAVNAPRWACLGRRRVQAGSGGGARRLDHSPQKARLDGRADQDAASCCRRTLPDARRYFSSAALMGRVPKDMIRNTASAPVGNQS